MPVLIIAGEDDRHMTLAQSKRLFTAANDPKRLWVISSAQHGDFYEHSPEAHARQLLSFFSEFMQDNLSTYNEEREKMVWIKPNGNNH